MTSLGASHSFTVGSFAQHGTIYKAVTPAGPRQFALRPHPATAAEKPDRVELLVAIDGLDSPDTDTIAAFNAYRAACNVTYRQRLSKSLDHLQTYDRLFPLRGTAAGEWAHGIGWVPAEPMPHPAPRNPGQEAAR